MFTLLSAAAVQAQEIQLYFPYFTGHPFEWKVFQGEKELTVRSGKIPPSGRLTLIMPDDYKDYRGMTRWMLKSGGGLDMIYVGRGFAVECLSEHPNDENIIYTGNPENEFLKTRHQRQKTVLDKLGAVNYLLQVYQPADVLYKTVLKEQETLRRQFEQLQTDRNSHSFYAARLGEIVDFTRGIADKIYENPTDHTRYFNDFVTHTLNFEDLYTSGHWERVLHTWLMMNIRPENGDQDHKERLDKALTRMERDLILGAFSEKAIPLLVQNGKDEIIPAIAAHLNRRPDAVSALTDTTRKMLSSFKILTGKKAPDLVFEAPVRTQTGKNETDIVLKTGSLDADHTILLFYKGTCPLCEDALIALANKYRWLAERNVRVIAISGDETEEGFEKKRIYHQWPDNYCDFTGMDGKNFTNYSVMGIPTLYLLDQKGIILKKTATVDDILGVIRREG